MTKNYLLCGVGGQGVVLSSKLIAFAGIKKGLNVKTTETIGMAQRGGSVVSHVRLSDSEVASPLISKGQADVIIAFEPAEAVRNLSYLKQNGLLIVSDKAVKPVTSTLSKAEYNSNEMLEYLKQNVNDLVIVDVEKYLTELKSSKVLNLTLLGIASKSQKFGFTLKEMEDTVLENVNKKFYELNIRALNVSRQ